MKIELTKKQMEMIWALEKLGNYGENPESVVEYLIARTLDDVLRSPGLRDYLRKQSGDKTP